MSMGGRSAFLGAKGDAEPRRCGQRHLSDANADQKDSCGPLAGGDADHQPCDRGQGREGVVEARMGGDRNRSPRPGRLHGKAEQEGAEYEGGDRRRLAEAEHEGRGHDRRRSDDLDRRVHGEWDRS